MFAFAPCTPLVPRTARANAICTRRCASTPKRHAPVMVLQDRDTRPVRITGNNIHLTDSLRDYVNEKLSKVVRRFSSLITKVDVHLTVEHNPSVTNRHKAEVLAFAGKTILRNEVRATDMYVAIDEVEERIGRTIRKFKERKVNKGIGKARDVPLSTGNSSTDDDEVEDDESFTDVYQDPAPEVPPVNAVVRRKVFPMPLQTVEEAVLCCEYVDHPWYLFRNAATKEISLVYRRNHGGYGLIEPSREDAVDDEPVE